MACRTGSAAAAGNNGGAPVTRDVFMTALNCLVASRAEAGGDAEAGRGKEWWSREGRKEGMGVGSQRGDGASRRWQRVGASAARVDLPIVVLCQCITWCTCVCGGWVGVGSHPLHQNRPPADSHLSANYPKSLACDLVVKGRYGTRVQFHLFKKLL